MCLHIAISSSLSDWYIPLSRLRYELGADDQHLSPIRQSTAGIISELKYWRIWVWAVCIPLWKYEVVAHVHSEWHMSEIRYDTALVFLATPNPQLNVNKNPRDATVCRYLFTAKLLYMFRVSQHPLSGVLKTVPAASGTGHTTCTATPPPTWSDRDWFVTNQSRSDHVGGE